MEKTKEIQIKWKYYFKKKNKDLCWIGTTQRIQIDTKKSIDEGINKEEIEEILDLFNQ